MDLHSEILVDFFHQPFENISASPLFIEYFQANIKDKRNWVILSVDKGCRKLNAKIATELGLKTVEFDKVRNFKTGEVEFLHSRGSVKGKNVICFDDFVSTGQTIMKSAANLKAMGAKMYYYCVTHIVAEDSLVKV